MTRYIITTTQLHSVIYKYLDNLIDSERDKKEQGRWNDGDYTMKLRDRSGKQLLFYIWYAPGGAYDDDDDTVHNGIGSLQIDPKIVDFIRRFFRIRESKVIDIVADWFSSKIDTEIDQVTIYPERKKPPVY